MRISTNESDSGYRTWLAHGGRATRWRVTLDGAEVRDCLVADEELGAVLALVLDADGDPVLRRGADGVLDLAKRWLRGRVVVERVGSGP